MMDTAETVYISSLALLKVCLLSVQTLIVILFFLIHLFISCPFFLKMLKHGK